MQPLIYSELVSWYRLLDPPADHEEEASCYEMAFERVVSVGPKTMLDLGAGAGNNAMHLKRRFRCTLADISEGMLALSRELNPECEHVRGDMRSLRLDRTFDAVLVHDAVTYMTTEGDLLLAAQTAFAHTRPGGAAIFTPDLVKETFHEDTEMLTADHGSRSLRGVAWTWDPDPTDDTMAVEYALLLRDGRNVKAVYDRHVEGLFARETWLRILRQVGYGVEPMPRPIGDGALDEVFLCRRA